MKNVLYLSLLSFLFLSSYAQAQLADTRIPLADVPEEVMPALDNKQLYDAEMARRGPGIAPRFAENIEVSITPETHGVWEVVDDETAVWRVRLKSNGARSLNLGFTKYNMPTGGSLYLYTPDLERQMGPFTPSDNEEHEQLWTPIVEGDEMVIEVQVPVLKVDELELTLSYVNHDYIGFASMAALSGSCNLDVICTETDGWGIVDGYRDIIQSVAVIAFGGGTFCTGFLINNVENDCTPFFMTAFHCGVNGGNAPSLVAYWNYQNSTCRQPNSPASGGAGDGLLNDFNSGAVLRANYSPTDVTLVEFDDPISETADGFFAGWDATDNLEPDTVIAIHHPSTDEKRISFEFDGTYVGNWGSGAASVPNGNHLVIADWDIGTTEPGSSGSPIYDSDRRVIGQLHGGAAACGNDAYDSYGWFHSSWTGGGSANNSLQPWLDPNNTGILTMDGTYVEACGFAVTPNITSQTVCATESATFELSVSEAFTAQVNLEAIGLPAGASASFSQNPATPGATVTLTITTTAGIATGSYNFTVTADDGTETADAALSLEVFDGAPAMVSLMMPTSGATEVTVMPTLVWGAIASAASYDVQLATDAGFTNLVVDESGLLNTDYDVMALNGLTTYYWRVRAGNSCGDSDWAMSFSFTTADILCATPNSVDVPVIIPNTGTPTVTSTLEFAQAGEIEDVNVVGLMGTHTWIADLTFTLTSPEGTTVVLVSNACEDEDNFNITFDDQAASGTLPCPYNDGGTYQPEGSLSAFNGENPQGPWTLSISDNYGDDGGALESWALDICLVAQAGVVTTPSEQTICEGDVATYTISVNDQFSGPVTITDAGLPGSAAVSYSQNPAQPGSDVVVTIDNLLGVAGNYNVTFNVSDGNSSIDSPVSLIIDGAPDIATLVSPADQELMVSTAPMLTWNAVVGASNYFVEVATDPNFTSIVYSDFSNSTSLTIPVASALGEETIYYWRVSAFNDCGASVSTGFEFTTEGGLNAQDLVVGNLSLSPNPATSELFLSFGMPIRSDVVLDLYKANGQFIRTEKLGVGLSAHMVEIATLPAGVYWLQLRNNQEFVTLRFVKD